MSSVAAIAHLSAIGTDGLPANDKADEPTEGSGCDERLAVLSRGSGEGPPSEGLENVSCQSLLSVGQQPQNSRMNRPPRRVCWAIAGLLTAVAAVAAGDPPRVALACKAGNDIHRVLQNSGLTWPRFDDPAEAVEAAAQGTGVMILADGDSAQTIPLSGALFKRAASKRLRLFVEYPSFVPGLALGQPRVAAWERAVVTSDAFGADLPKRRILSLHQCSFIPMTRESAHLVLARVAGYDTTVFGLPKQGYSLLFELPEADAGLPVLVSAARLSQFVTARYAPTEAWQGVWQMILRWLAPDTAVPPLRWKPSVRPSYGRDEPLPLEVENRALRRGVEWFEKSKLLLHPSRLPEIAQRAAAGDAPAPPVQAPIGDGSLGILEGYLSRVQTDGRQLQTVARRGDCTAESAMALAFAGKAFEEPRYTDIARNLLDFYLFISEARKGERGDVRHGAYGLVAWGISTPAWMVANYGDDNARLLLGTLATAALTRDDRWDEAVLLCLLANLRTTGPLGFRGDRIDLGPLGTQGWEFFFRRRLTNYAPHYESYLWACYLWAWHKTGLDLFRERAKTAIRRTMTAYPGRWRWTNGLQQERARMLLPLAWLVRIEDTPEHRAWLRRVAGDLLGLQDASGALREQMGELARGQLIPPQSNEAYGTGEAPLLQQNGDPVCDLLYTCNFALLGLHEAAAATGDALYLEAEDKLVRFLCRIQIRSEQHPELDGGWFRAFDFRRWDYWASSSDSGWGAWCIESGWTQGWITSVLAARRLKTSFWELTSGSALRRHLEKLRPAMIPDRVLTSEVPQSTRYENQTDFNGRRPRHAGGHHRRRC
jgi:hypothetical protein